MATLPSPDCAMHCMAINNPRAKTDNGTKWCCDFIEDSSGKAWKRDCEWLSHILGGRNCTANVGQYAACGRSHESDCGKINFPNIQIRLAVRKLWRCAASRKASVPPGRVVENAPARLPLARHFARFDPRRYSCRKPASKLSPAPTGSTASTVNGELTMRSLPRRARAPLRPSFTTTRGTS